MKIEVTSAGFEAGNYAKITVNDEQIQVTANPGDNHSRGLHLVVINQADEKIVIAQVFDTYKTSGHLERFIDEFTL